MFREYSRAPCAALRLPIFDIFPPNEEETNGEKPDYDDGNNGCDGSARDTLR